MHKRELRPDSEGAGRHRGGFGQEMEFGVRGEDGGAPWTLSAMYDRTRFPAPVMLGGGDGEAGSVGTASGGSLHPKRQQRIPAGERVILKLPGGGGYGDPLERDPELVRRDTEDGLISLAHAREAYGVVLIAEEACFSVEEEATERLRAERTL